MIIMGIDPGSKITGYGIIEKQRDILNWIVDGQIAPSNRLSFYEKIFDVFSQMRKILDDYRPEEIAIEDIFYSKNVKSSIRLGHVRGAIIVAALLSGIPIFEYTPLQVKKAVVGYGKATKEQVRDMVRIILDIERDMGLDSSDALAVAICHANHANYVSHASIRNS